MENFTVFYQALKDTSIFVSFLANSTNIDAVSWLTYAIENNPDDFTTLHQYWNEIRTELDSILTINSAMVQELVDICNVANIVTFSFDENGYVIYV
jgi:hypothetical protein